MSSKRPYTLLDARAAKSLPRSVKSHEQYQQLYPKFRSRVNEIVNSEIPFVRERLTAMSGLLNKESLSGQEWFARKFALTPIQARIAIYLAEGGTVIEYAEASGTAAATVRSHLKAIFKKTGATRQAELGALLTRR